VAAQQKKRQKKLERRSAQRKQRQKTLINKKNRGLAEQMAAASSCPVLHSYISETVWDDGLGGGLGGVLISRELPHGSVAFAMFLVDRSCLGVKDAFGRVTSRAEYDRFVKETNDHYELLRATPADVRNLVEGSVQYARDLGLEPHPDYRRLAPIFGDIDAQDAEAEFQFGDENGKPHFMAGPNETPQRCYQILSILEHTCGKGGFDFTIPFIDCIPKSLRGGVRVISEDGEEFENLPDVLDDEEDEDW
jgi:hypothetical protein